MRLVLIESPYGARSHKTKLTYKDYLDQCILDCIRRGEAPFASHRMYTRALNDHNPSERELGMTLGWEWLRVVEHVVVYEDYGISRGMETGIERAKSFGFNPEYRKIFLGVP